MTFKPRLDKEHTQIMCMYAIIVMVIFAYWAFLQNNGSTLDTTKTDPLNRALFHMPWGHAVSWWPISHFFGNMLLGFVFPQKGVFIIGAGILWEIIEVILGWHARYLDAKKGAAKKGDAKNGDAKKGQQIKEKAPQQQQQYTEQWWAGSYQDVAFNIAGFFAGKFLREGCFAKI